MAYKEVHRVEISEVIRRWQAGNSQRSIATGTGLSRETVRRSPAYAGAGSGGCLGSRGGPGRASRHCRPAQRVGVGEPFGAAGAGSAQRGEAGPLVGPDLSVAHPGPAAVHQDPGVAGGAGLPGIVFLRAPVAKPAPLAATPQRRRTGTRGGRIRRAAFRRPTPLGQGAAGPQAHPPGATLHSRTPRFGVPQNPGGGPDRWAPRGAHPAPGFGTSRASGTSPPLPAGRFARPGSVFAPAKGHRRQSTESTELKTGGQS